MHFFLIHKANSPILPPQKGKFLSKENRQSRQAYTPSQALKKVRNWSAKKRNAAVIHRKVLGKKFPSTKQ
jgi:hypothetical protein